MIPGDWMTGKSGSLQTVVKRLAALEKRVSQMEKRVLPEFELSAKERRELAKLRQEIERGDFVSEKELFEALTK